MSIDALSLWILAALTPQLALMICADRSARAPCKSTLGGAISRSSSFEELASWIRPASQTSDAVRRMPADSTQYCGDLGNPNA